MSSPRSATGSITTIPSTRRAELRRDSSGTFPDARKDRFALRVGLVIILEDKPISEMIAYAEVAANLVEKRDPATPLTAAELDATQAEVLAVVDMALQRVGRSATTTFRPIYHVANPPMCSFPEAFSSDDGMVNVFPTRIVGRENERVSPVSIGVAAYSRATASVDGAARFALVNAVLCLAFGAPFKPAALRWPASPQRREFMEAGDNAGDLGYLFPSGRRARVPSDRELVQDPKPFVTLWNAVRGVPQFEGSAAENALFAYARSLELGSAPTLAVVCQLAALGALSHELMERCAGQTSCSVHGRLSPHNITGDAAAIIKLCGATLSACGQTFDTTALAKTVRRVYAEQRSSFAHEAIVRHRENSRGAAVQTAGPGANSPSTVDLARAIDARFVADLTRRVLIARIGELGGTDVASVLPTSALRAAGQYGGALRIPRGTVLRLDVRGPPNQTAPS